MINDDRTQIKKTLLQIPDGTLRVERYSSDLDGMHLPAEHLHGQIDGKGLIEAYQPFPGIEVAINTIQAGQAAFHHEALSSVLEVNYCRAGRVGWNNERKCCGLSGSWRPCHSQHGLLCGFRYDIARRLL